MEEWFGPPDPIDELREEFLVSRDSPPGVRGYIALVDDRPIGFIQTYVAYQAGDGWWPDETDPGARGIDQFLADASSLGRGLGTVMVREFIAFLLGDSAVTKVQADPSPDNRRAIRCYEKAGFGRVGVVDTPDGPAMFMVCSRASFEARHLEPR